jgi:thioredoxin reductase (NADPH)
VNGKYDYDMVVVGGGSGGLAASKECAKMNRNLKVAVLDFVKPSPLGTTWGLGGTCVNVGCIPKKLMHYSGSFRNLFEDAAALGWNTPGVENKVNTVHSWDKMINTVDDYIRGLNFNYKKALKEEKVTYFNAYGTFKDAHTIVMTDIKGKVTTITTDKVLIAVGGRPRLPDCPGAELGLTSDDLFWWTKKPIGKILVNGAGYIALECAGFLHEIGCDVSIIVRSIPLRGFDEQVAHQVCETLEREGVRFIKPATITKMEQLAGADGKITVTWADAESKQVSTEEFDTVFHAIGRDAIIKDLGLDKCGVAVKDGKIVVDEMEQTNVNNIFSIGDCALGRPELTPVAIQAGQALARRLYGKSKLKMDYNFIPTTVFTPMEYGAVGYSQDAAEKAFGKNNIESYASRFGVLETATTYHETIPKPRSKHFIELNLWARKHALAHKQEWKDFKEGDYDEEDRARKYMKQPCLAKLVVDKSKHNRVVGFHYLGPNAGEITQGFALALKAGAAKEHFDSLVGIHPTAAEEFTQMHTTLSSGEDFMKKGGC